MYYFVQAGGERRWHIARTTGRAPTLCGQVTRVCWPNACAVAAWSCSTHRPLCRQCSRVYTGKAPELK